MVDTFVFLTLARTGDQLQGIKKGVLELADVLTMSALHGDGLTKLWDTVLEHRLVLADAGEFEAKRRAQQVDWTWWMVRDTVLDRILSHPDVRRIRAEVERRVREGELTPALAAQEILAAAER
jgi:LAO/AO transport system kinase